MAKIDKLIKQAQVSVSRKRVRAGLMYDYSKLTTGELKELAFGDPTEERLNELIVKMTDRGCMSEKIK